MKSRKIEYYADIVNVRRVMWHPGNQYDPAGYYANIRLGDNLHVVLISACSEPDKDLEGDISG